jgi:pimeloyl-ACP methyl ester carboxylesterase
MKTKAILLTAIATLLLSESKAKTQEKMTEKKVAIRENQVEINYYQLGKGDTTILFLHGWCINGFYWQNQITDFAKTYTVCSIDLPGFGKSKANRVNWTIEEYAKDISHFIDTLNLKNVILVGHSMSGEIILQTALSNNPRIIGVVGVDNFKFIDVEFTPEQMKQMTDFFPMLQNDFKNSAPIYADNMLFHPSTPLEIKENVKKDFANTDPAIGYGTFMNQMQYAYNDPQKLELLHYKLYLINSDGFPTNEEGLKKHCKMGFEIKNISGTGHYPMIEKPKEFNQLLEEILKEIK